MSDDAVRVNVPDMCKTHQSLLVAQAGYSSEDPWMALLICAQIALFQAATTRPKTYERLGGDIERISELGCLACYRPDSFGEVVEAAKTRNLGDIKRLGEKWVAESAKEKA